MRKSEFTEEQIAFALSAESASGRALVITATSVDMQEMHLWDVTAEAGKAVAENQPDRIRQILLASSAIPNGWNPPRPGLFNKETMNAMADMGEKMGADPSSWSVEPP